MRKIIEENQRHKAPILHWVAFGFVILFCVLCVIKVNFLNGTSIVSDKALSEVFEHKGGEISKHSNLGVGRIYKFVSCNNEQNDDAITVTKIEFDNPQSYTCFKDTYQKIYNKLDFEKNNKNYAIFVNSKIVNNQKEFGIKEICISRFASQGILSEYLEIIYTANSKTYINNQYDTICYL